MDPRQSTPVIYRGELVAIAGPTRFHILVSELCDDDLRVVLLMCLLVAANPDREDDAVELSRRTELRAIRALRTLDQARRR